METLDIEVPEATERRCYRCGVTRPISMFYVEMERKRREREGRRSWSAPCRLCQREINTSHREQRQSHADKVKMERGCADCGIRSDHPEIYDFDHLPGAVKVNCISALLTKGTWDHFVAEIEKCEVVCANCHRIRTRSRASNGFGRSRS